MEKGHGVGKVFVQALAILLLILDLVLIGVAITAFDRAIYRTPPLQPPKGFNEFSLYSLLFALIEAPLLLAAVICGLSHGFHYNAGSVGAAVATGVIAWAVDILALGPVWNEISVGQIGPRQKAIDVLVIIILFFETIYISILIGGLHSRRLGVGYSSAV